MSDKVIGLFYVLGSILLESAGQIFLKKSADFNLADRSVARVLQAIRDKWFATGIICFVLEFISWTLALQRLDVSLAYQLSCLTFIAVSFFSRYWLSEYLDRSRWIGLICIVMGSILVGTS